MFGRVPMRHISYYINSIKKVIRPNEINIFAFEHFIKNDLYDPGLYVYTSTGAYR